MRHIILDTETTGLDPKLGHRIIEVAAVEMVDRRPTGRTLQIYVDPEREIDAGGLGSARNDLGRPEGQAELRRGGARSSSSSRAARRGSSTTRLSTSAFLDKEFETAKLPAVRGLVWRPDRHAGACARGVSRQAQQSRRAVRALRRVQRASHAARRAAGCATAGRSLSRDDARAGIAHHRHGRGAIAGRERERVRIGGARVRCWWSRCRRPRNCRRTRRTSRHSTARPRAAACGSPPRRTAA